MASLSCLLVDDHPVILRALAGYLSDEGIEVAGSVATGAGVLELVALRLPDVVLLDIRLPDASGLEVARQLASSAPDVGVVLYTAEASAALVRQALDANVRGIVIKGAPLSDVARALTIAGSGGSYLDPSLGLAFAEATVTGPGLTQREREVLRLLTDGCDIEQIAAKLFLSSHTVRAHIRRILHRLGAKTRTQAVAVALREGFIA